MTLYTCSAVHSNNSKSNNSPLYLLINTSQATEVTRHKLSEEREYTQQESRGVKYGTSNFRRMETLGEVSLRVKNTLIFSNVHQVSCRTQCTLIYAGAESVLDTNPSGMQARIRACLLYGSVLVL